MERGELSYSCFLSFCHEIRKQFVEIQYQSWIFRFHFLDLGKGKVVQLALFEGYLNALLSLEEKLHRTNHPALSESRQPKGLAGRWGWEFALLLGTRLGFIRIERRIT